MRTVSSRVNDKEFEAITEYANQCGETVSNVLKKAVFERAAKSKTKGCPEGYHLNRYVPDGVDKDTVLTKNVNKIRHILGWDEQSTPAKKKSITVDDVVNRINEEANKIKEGVGAEEEKEKPTLMIDDIARRIREEEAEAAAEKAVEELSKRIDVLDAQIEEYVRARDSFDFFYPSSLHLSFS